MLLEVLSRMLRRIRSLVSNSKSFIEIYDNALTSQECDLLISQFEKFPQRRGLLRDGEIPEYKSCTELIDTDFRNSDVISNVIKHNLTRCIDEYTKKYRSLNELGLWGIDPFYNFQKYDGEDEGYKIWHTERGPHVDCAPRILVWMFYLNNAESGTEFMHFPTVNPKKGRCIVWPGGWEYTHKGVTPNKGIKYIITGWCSYLE